MTACEEFLGRIDKTMAKTGLYLYAAFVDFKAAFDSGSRQLVLERLARIGVPYSLTELIRNILQENPVVLNDGVCLRRGIVQTNGYTQGDNLSPCLFSILISDLPERVKHRNVEAIQFADDLVLFSHSRLHLQQALAKLSKYVEEIGIEINSGKTEAMKFRRGGPLANNDVLRINGQEIGFVNRFTYLGMTLTTRGQSFTQHIIERQRKALVAALSIRNPGKLSLKTVVTLFHMKIEPVASYGVPLVWEKLSASDLALLDRIKPAFLKRSMGLHRTARNRQVYLLAGTQLFIEDLRKRYGLAETEAYRKLIEQYERKMAEVNPEFYATTAMTSDKWKGPNQKHRHVITRFAIHGFHNRVCSRESYHEPDEECKCKKCGGVCTLYHARYCEKVESLVGLGSE